MNSDKTVTVRIDAKLARAVRTIAKREHRPIKTQLNLLVKFALMYGFSPQAAIFNEKTGRYEEPQEVNHEGPLTKQTRGKKAQSTK